MKTIIIGTGSVGVAHGLTALIEDALKKNDEQVIILNNNIGSTPDIHEIYHEQNTSKENLLKEVELLINEDKLLSTIPSPQHIKNNSKINHRRKPRNLFHNK